MPTPLPMPTTAIVMLFSVSGSDAAEVTLPEVDARPSAVASAATDTVMLEPVARSPVLQVMVWPLPLQDRTVVGWREQIGGRGFQRMMPGTQVIHDQPFGSRLPAAGKAGVTQLLDADPSAGKLQPVQRTLEGKRVDGRRGCQLRFSLSQHLGVVIQLGLQPFPQVVGLVCAHGLPLLIQRELLGEPESSGHDQSAEQDGSRPEQRKAGFGLRGMAQVGVPVSLRYRVSLLANKRPTAKPVQQRLRYIL